MGEPGRFTRRTMLGRAAAAGAASLAAPGVAVAHGYRSALSERFLGRLTGTSPPISAPRRFSLAGVQWDGPGGAAIELRALTTAGQWTRWVPAGSLGHDPDGGARVGGMFGEPLWTGPASSVQLRARETVSGVRVHFVSVQAPGEALAGVAQAEPLAQPVLDAGPGQPPIIARRAWALGQARPGPFAGLGSVKLAFVHHTVNPNGYGPSQVPGLLRGVFDFHRYVRGYLDIAYNFLIDAYGRIWEGRAGGIDMPVIGAHAGGYNAESTGVAMLGDFMGVVPTPAAMHALEQLLAWKLSLHGIPARGQVTVVVDPASAFYTPYRAGALVSLPRIAGHRDGDLTDCPGNALYHRLPGVRRRVVELAGAPARLTATGPTVPVLAGTPLTIGGSLALLDGSRLVAAPLELQQFASRGNVTVAATVQTAADGSWTQQLTLVRNALMRAVHASAPACVSDWLGLAVAPVLTLTVQSTSPLTLTGTVAPDKPHVVVDLYQAGATSKPVRQRQVPGASGEFTATFNPPPGNYVAIARTLEDDLNAAGASAPVAVSVA